MAAMTAVLRHAVLLAVATAITWLVVWGPSPAPGAWPRVLDQVPVTLAPRTEVSPPAAPAPRPVLSEAEPDAGDPEPSALPPGSSGNPASFAVLTGGLPCNPLDAGRGSALGRTA